MSKHECRNCKYVQFDGSKCRCGHGEIYTCAHRYCKEKNRVIHKEPSFIGFKLPKGHLRWCPLKYLENDINAINAGGKE